MHSIRTIQPSDANVPILLHTKIQGVPNKDTLKALENLAHERRLFHHLAALSEVHKKKDTANPAGSVAVSKTHLIPQLMDAAPNCGMRLIATDLTDEDIQNNLDELFRYIQAGVPTKKYIGTSVPLSVITDTFMRGSAAVADYLDLRIEEEIDHTQFNGDLFEGRSLSKKELLAAIPPNIIRGARHRLGIMGATGSHFLSLLKADKILNKEQAKGLGIHQGQYLFYMHTGSGIIGRYIAYLYSPQRRLASHKIALAVGRFGYRNRQYAGIDKQLKAAITSGELLGYEVGTERENMASIAINAAGNQGFANRTMLSHQLDLALEKALGRQVQLRLVYDVPHVFAMKEKHFNQEVWVHRNGATRAQKGEPVLIAPFEQSFGYVGIGQGSKTTFSSANHEIGKVHGLDKKALEVVGTFSEPLSPARTYTEEGMSEINPKPAHAAYAEAIAKEIEQNDIMKLAARLRPIATLTYYRK